MSLTRGRYEVVVRARRTGPAEELLTTAELARLCGVHPALLDRFYALGLVDPARQAPERLFRVDEAARVRRILRLRRDLGVHFTAAGVVLDLLDRVEELERRLGGG